MQEAIRQLFWSTQSKAQTIGVQLVGDAVKQSGAVLSGFTGSSYAKLPFTVGLLDKPWSLVFAFTYKTAEVPMGMFGAVGDGDGFSPFFTGANGISENFNSHQAYLNGVGWPITWSSGSINARQFIDKDYVSYVAFDGIDTYSTGDIGSEPLAVFKSTAFCDGKDMPLHIGANRGREYPFLGSVDLSKCCMLVNEEIIWEGVLGAHERILKLV